MAEQYISIKIILDKLLRHPLMRDISLETVVDYTIDFMRIVGVPNMFVDKTESIFINNYKAALPCDYYQMIQVKKHKGEFLRYSTDTFHFFRVKENKDNNIDYDLTYKIQGNIIFTSFKKGQLDISYKAILIDEDMYPLIPNNSSFTRALELYIKRQWFTIKFDLGELNINVLLNVQKEYSWAVGDCQNEFNRLSLDKAESFYNTWRTLLIRDREHDFGFKNLGTKENIKLD